MYSHSPSLSLCCNQCCVLVCYSYWVDLVVHNVYQQIPLVSKVYTSILADLYTITALSSVYLIRFYYDYLYVYCAAKKTKKNTLLNNQKWIFMPHEFLFDFEILSRFVFMFFTPIFHWLWAYVVCCIDDSVVEQLNGCGEIIYDMIEHWAEKWKWCRNI